MPRSILTNGIDRFATFTTASVEEQEAAMRDGMLRAEDTFAALKMISSDVIGDATALDATTVWTTNARVRDAEVKVHWIYGFRLRLRVLADLHRRSMPADQTRKAGA